MPQPPSLLKRKRTLSEVENGNSFSENRPSGSEEASEWGILELNKEFQYVEVFESPDSVAVVEISSEPGSDMDSTIELLTPRPLDVRSPTWSEDTNTGTTTQFHPVKRFRNFECPLTPLAERLSPLPVMNWADSQEVWDLMCQKDVVSMSQRNEDMFIMHPCIQPRMRAILLDWISEVCEVYKLHRETFHLAIDFIDRYLSNKKDIPKAQLQLIGVTCLFIAAKVEEIYPPKIQEFAYVTDGACTENEILDKELVILKTLNWSLSPVTVNGWLTMYIQMCSNRRLRFQQTNKKDVGFVYPQYSGLTFVQTVQLVDLCMLDEGCLRYPYSVLAASALYHMLNKELALSVSGFEWEDIQDCVNWTLPFALTIHEERSSTMTSGIRQGISMGEHCSSSGLLKSIPNIVMDNSHLYQTHTVDLQLLEQAFLRQSQLESSLVSSSTNSPMVVPDAPGLLTPPSSSKKPSDRHLAVAESLS